jgi:glucosamine--fructose-6-phosphate aminotransferase (isomerizing)
MGPLATSWPPEPPTGDFLPFLTAMAGQAATLEAAVPQIRRQILDHQATGLQAGPGPILVGIGASLAAACAPVWVLRSRGIHAWRLAAGDHPLPFPPSRHPVVAVSQSGRSSETIAVLESVDPGRRIAVVNLDPSPLAEIARSIIRLGNVADSYASTIGYSVTLAGLGMLAEAWDGGLLDPGWDALANDVRAIDESLAPRLPELGAQFDGIRQVDVIGTAASVGSAEAGALLLREVARLPATALSTRTYLHGAMESAGGGLHVILGDEREIEVGRTLARAGQRVILLTSSELASEPGITVIALPVLPPSRRAVIEAVILQRLAAAVAIRAGLDIDAFVFDSDDTKVAAARPTDGVR